jgi:hypothetical protein
MAVLFETPTLVSQKLVPCNIKHLYYKHFSPYKHTKRLKHVLSKGKNIMVN